MGVQKLPGDNIVIMIQDVETSVQIAIGLSKEEGLQWADQVRRKLLGLTVVEAGQLPPSKPDIPS